jgi:hypothetical protein
MIPAPPATATAAEALFKVLHRALFLILLPFLLRDHSLHQRLHFLKRSPHPWTALLEERPGISNPQEERPGISNPQEMPLPPALDTVPDFSLGDSSFSSAAPFSPEPDDHHDNDDHHPPPHYTNEFMPGYDDQATFPSNTDESYANSDDSYATEFTAPSFPDLAESSDDATGNSYNNDGNEPYHHHHDDDDHGPHNLSQPFSFPDQYDPASASASVLEWSDQARYLYDMIAENMATDEKISKGSFERYAEYNREHFNVEPCTVVLVERPGSDRFDVRF